MKPKIAATSTAGQLLLDLRAAGKSGMESADVFCRFGSAAGPQLKDLIQMRFIRLEARVYYLTPQGITACPLRNPASATVGVRQAPPSAARSNLGPLTRNPTPNVIR